MNNAIEEKGLVPTRLVFVVIQRFPIISTQLSEQIERIELFAATQADMNATIKESKMTTASTRDIPQQLTAFINWEKRF